MNILLTGHRGFIGQHMLRALESRGHVVNTYEWGDNNLPSVMEQDWVIHLGAISSTVERDVDKVLVAIGGDPDVVFDAHTHLFFFNINAGLNGKDHACFDGFSLGTEVMHIDTQVVGNAVIQVFAVGPVVG